MAPTPNVEFENRSLYGQIRVYRPSERHNAPMLEQSGMKKCRGLPRRLSTSNLALVSDGVNWCRAYEPRFQNLIKFAVFRLAGATAGLYTD